MLGRLDLRALPDLGLLIVPAVVLPLAGLVAVALDSHSPGHSAVAEASETVGLAASLVQPTPFKVKPFQVELPIPPELAPVRSEGGIDYFEVSIDETKVHIPGLPEGLNTTVWAFDGRVPGPTIRAHQGRPQVVRFTNRLPQAVGETCCTIHRHGGHQPPIDDGHPVEVVRPGTYKDYHFPNDDPDDVTLWYHDHENDATGHNVNMGLAGIYPLETPLEADLQAHHRLPDHAHEVPLILQDRLFKADGSFNYPIEEPGVVHNGFLGDVQLVNGAVQPVFRVATRKYRFRILDASNSRQYQLALSNGQPFIQVATEGSLLPKPVLLSTFRISPAERIGVVIDFSKVPVGSQVVLLNLGGDSKNLRLDGAPREVMRFDVVRQEEDPVTLPDVLDPKFSPPKESDAVRTRRFVLERNGVVFNGVPFQWTINHLPFDPERIDATVPSGDVEIWELVNPGGGWTHPLHIHLTEYLVLDRNGGPPLPEESGMKDVFLIRENETVRVIGHFDGIVSPGPGRPIYERTFPFHCHNLEHEDHAMMGHFEPVPRPGFMPTPAPLPVTPAPTAVPAPPPAMPAPTARRAPPPGRP